MYLYPIFSRRVVRLLESRGFTVVEIRPNKVKPGFLVYFFEETPALRKAVTEIINSFHNA